jgi:hypothetical protein
MKKHISIVTPCYNEESNVAELHQRGVHAMNALGPVEISLHQIEDVRDAFRRLAPEPIFCGARSAFIRGHG